MDLLWAIVLAIGAAILVAMVTAVVAFFAGGRRFKSKIKDAPSVYTERLGALIEAAFSEGPERAIINASAIVSVRNEMRVSLVSISNNLNSEITHMEQLLGGDDTELSKKHKIEKLKHEKVADASPEELFRLIEILRKTWPEKRIIIEVQVRKLLAELGLERA